MESNTLWDGLSDRQKALMFTRMCELVDEAVLGIRLHDRPLTVADLVNELASAEQPGAFAGVEPRVAHIVGVAAPARLGIIDVGYIHKCRPIRPLGFSAVGGTSPRVYDMFKMPDNLTLKAAAQGSEWRKALKKRGYSVSSRPDGFGRLELTLKRYGQSLTLIQGTSVPVANAVKPGAYLDPFMLQDLRFVGALIEQC